MITFCRCLELIWAENNVEMHRLNWAKPFLFWSILCQENEMFTWLSINSRIVKTGEEKRRYICKGMGEINRYLKKVKGRVGNNNWKKAKTEQKKEPFFFNLAYFFILFASRLSVKESYQNTTSRFDHEIIEDWKIMMTQSPTAKYFVFSLLFCSDWLVKLLFGDEKEVCYM